MTLRCSILLRSGLLAVGISLAVVEAGRAQQAPLPPPAPPPPPAPQWTLLSSTPYLWLPWTSTNIRPSFTRIPSVSETIDPGDLVTHLTWVPFMGSAELRNGPLGIEMDYFHAPLKNGVNTRDILFSGATAGLSVDSGSIMFLYRAIAHPGQYFDAGLGARVWGLDGSISLNQGLLPAVTVSRGLDWVDPLLGARYHRDFGNGFGATASGDVGGFGLGAHIDWQILATVDYTWKPGIDAHLGFRSLNFNYGGPLADFNTHMYGPLISVTFRF